MSESCPSCDDFRWLPRGVEPGWFARDWRLILHPGLSWDPCPVCHRGGLDLVQEAMSRHLLERLDREVRSWHAVGAWRAGRLGDGQAVLRWGHIAVLPPGPENQCWSLVSTMGVLRDLDRARCKHHCHEAGAPDLP